MAAFSHKTIGDDSLERWKVIGTGGFGHVYKARHKDLGFDVAIKTLHHVVCPFMSLNEEATHMDKASCEFVLRRYGIYQGYPLGAKSMQNGIVMEFMGGGSLEFLQRALSGPPPWPLVFRFAHQVALGMNFLHLHGLMHQDLKPSNVLLSIDLNAKIADFGLCRVSTSAMNNNKESREESPKIIGGSYKYMPPEAFKELYEPVRDFDVYSYGILLWSIVNGKEPYGTASYEHVEEAINDGQRPSLEELDQQRFEGLNELVDLMKRCWDGTPSKRGTFKACLKDTEPLYLKHENGFPEAVQQVSARLKSPNSHQHSKASEAFSASPQTPEQPKSNDTVDFRRFTRTERSSVKESVSIPTKTMSDSDKERFVKDNRAKLIQGVSEVMAIVEELGDLVHRETYSKIDAQVTNQGKMRLLYNRTFHSGGTVVMAAFYDALKMNEPELVKRLGGSL